MLGLASGVGGPGELLAPLACLTLCMASWTRAGHRHEGDGAEGRRPPTSAGIRHGVVTGICMIPRTHVRTRKECFRRKHHHGARGSGLDLCRIAVDALAVERRAIAALIVRQPNLRRDLPLKRFELIRPQIGWIRSRLGTHCP